MLRLRSLQQKLHAGDGRGGNYLKSKLLFKSIDKFRNQNINEKELVEGVERQLQLGKE